ncbi:MAG: hypothetical protein DSY55_04305 [Clostridia bacterium]|nr:MAG: hypothetical protein DSY55_04305 [Clostridia bacterium]
MQQRSHRMDAIIIRNPISGDPRKQRSFERAIDVFEAAGWQVQVWITEYKGHSRSLAEQAARAGHKRVVIAGGDGSIGQAVDGLLRSGVSDVSLGIIPMGTGNVFAREAGLPFPKRLGDDAPARAARIIIENDPLCVDVGRANNDSFLCWAGVGLDAAVTECVESRLAFKRRLPILSYAATAIRTMGRYQPVPGRVVVDDGETISGDFAAIIVANIQLYARYFRLTPAAKIDDGRLDLLIFEEQSKLSILYRLLKVAIFPRSQVHGVIRRSVQRVLIETSPPQPYHLDGDPLGRTPVTIQVVPHKLWVHLDRKRSSHLLRK